MAAMVLTRTNLVGLLLVGLLLALTAGATLYWQTRSDATPEAVEEAEAATVVLAEAVDAADGTDEDGATEEDSRESSARLQAPAEPNHPQGQNQGFVKLVSGANHTCALRVTGEVFCWGQNNEGQLGVGSSGAFYPGIAYSSTPVQVDIARVADITADLDHTCARTQDGEVFCWGANAFSAFSSTRCFRGCDTPQRIPEFQRSDDLIETAERRSCQIIRGHVDCWGQHQRERHRIPGVDDAVALAVTYTELCVLRASGEVWCTGRNLAEPQRIEGIEGSIQSIGSPGAMRFCALMEDHTVVCWRTYNGELRETLYTMDLPPVRTLAMGHAWACAALMDGAVKCWDTLQGDEAEITEVAGLQGSVLSLSVGLHHACGFVEDQGVYCWGSETLGQTGAGRVPHRATPVAMDHLPTVREIALREEGPCFLTADHDEWICQQGGELIRPEESPKPAPREPHEAFADDELRYTLPGSISCALTAAGEVICLGSNGFDEDTGEHFGYRREVLAEDVIDAVGTGHWGCGLHSDATVTCWHGSPGGCDDSFFFESRPLDSVDDAHHLALYSGFSREGGRYICYVRTDGGVSCQGSHNFLQLGDSTTTARNSVRDFVDTGLSDVQEVAVSYGYACALHTDGRVSCWGRNDEGQIDAGPTQAERPVPVVLP